MWIDAISIKITSKTLETMYVKKKSKANVSENRQMVKYKTIYNSDAYTNYKSPY